MTTRVYLSSDAGAPSCSAGTAGSRIAMLKACLVDGYGAKPGAGWTQVFSGSNKAVFRSGGSGDRHYLRVYDGDTNKLAVRGYISMSNVNTGDDPYPSVAQYGGEGVGADTDWYYSYNPCAWAVVANEYAFYMTLYAAANASQMAPGGSLVEQAGCSMMFGRFGSDVLSDTLNHCLLYAAGSYNSGYLADLGLTGTAQDGSSAARQWLAGNPVSAGSKKFSRLFLGNAQKIGVGTGFGYPDVHTGGIRVQSQVPILEAYAGSILWRGRLPGVAYPLSDIAPLMLTTINGTGSLAGRQWFVVPMVGYPNIQYWMFDTLDDWGN